MEKEFVPGVGDPVLGDRARSLAEPGAPGAQAPEAPPAPSPVSPGKKKSQSAKGSKKLQCKNVKSCI